MVKRVAIIGAGFSGIMAAKYALENDLEPVVFERNDEICGLWSTKNTAIWGTLKTIITKYATEFSDHPWPRDTQLYPWATEMNEYLQSYAKKFDVIKNIRLNHLVKFVKQIETNKWEITFEDLVKKEVSTEIFEFLVMASGTYSEPKLPSDENASAFKGLIMHRSQFRAKDERLKGKKVLVIGGSISSVEVSDLLVGHVESVTHVFRSPPIITSRLWKMQIDEPNKYIDN